MGLLPQNLNVDGLAEYAGLNLLKLNQQQLLKIRGKKIAMIFQEPMTALNPLHRIEKIIGEPLWLDGLSKNAVRP